MTGTPLAGIDHPNAIYSIFVDKIQIVHEPPMPIPFITISRHGDNMGVILCYRGQIRGLNRR